MHPTKTYQALDAIRTQMSKEVPFGEMPVGAAEVSLFLNKYLPHILTRARAFVDLPGMTSGLDLVEAVSWAVKDGLPYVKGVDARVVVEGVLVALWRSEVEPHLPRLIRLFAGVVLRFLLSSVTRVYETRVR